MTRPPAGERTLQRYADDILKPEYVQPLKTVEDACKAVGWEFAERPVCCGQEVECRSFIIGAYEAECSVCGALIHDISGPQFGNGHVRTLDAEQFDPGALEVAERWIAIPASADTHPKGGDVKQAPLVSGAVPDRADAQETPSPAAKEPSRGNNRDGQIR